MKIIKTAKSFTDLEKWILHGVDPQACRDEFKEVHAKRRKMEQEATRKSKELGHELFTNWTHNSNRCRKCGMSIKLPNVLAQTDAPDSIGAAATEKCTSNLNTPKDYFNLSDHLLNKGVPLNREPDDTIL